MTKKTKKAGIITGAILCAMIFIALGVFASGILEPPAEKPEEPI